MSQLFQGDSDSDVDIKTNNEYAKSYNTWRKKEELNKLKTKYGSNADESDQDSSSSSEDDDDEAVGLDENLEKDFFTTLSSLKNRDPKIYDENVRFFSEEPVDPYVRKKSAKNDPMYLKDYERKLLLEKGGQLSDSEEEENPRARSPTYVEEQRNLKEKLKDELNKIKEEEEDAWGGLFQVRQKTKNEVKIEESEYKEWLLGQKNRLKDEDAAKTLKPLKDFWTDPKLDDGEKFLRDYILNKKFLDREDEETYPTYEEVVHDSDNGLSEDEKAVEKQEEFEHKYNYRFEEPDQEFIKRYPRTMENSLRKTDDRRKLKRAEVKERKVKEKEAKMQELKQLKEMKRQEIEEKLKRLREITGNTEVAFEDDDLEEDFDPDAHDKRMRKLFDEEFYQGEEGEQKPEFPDLDEELEIERWDRYNPEKSGGGDVPHCEDEDFNMDCEYDPVSTQTELIENSKDKRKRKRKSKFAKVVSEPKPVFDPDDKTYEEYLDEYYKLDCEDIIGDIPCRFKYRNVTPNSFGLTIDEILRANDKELNRWCSIKKAVQIRPDHVEKYDLIAYGKKGQNEALKRKLLPSLYKDEVNSEVQPEKTDLKNRKRKRKDSNNTQNQINKEEVVQSENNDENVPVKMEQSEDKNVEVLNKSVPAKKRKKKGSSSTQNHKEEVLQGEDNQKNVPVKMEQSEGKNVEVAPENDSVPSKKRKKNKKQKGLENGKDVQATESKTEKSNPILDKPNKLSETKSKLGNPAKTATNGEIVKSKKKEKKRLTKSDSSSKVLLKKKPKKGEQRKMSKGPKGKKAKTQGNAVELSDARLQAFGFRPKKFKNKMKYGRFKQA